jgi:hypothetical protein
VAAYVAAFVLVLATNRALVLSGTVSYSVWGWIWYVPLLLADGRLKLARRVARQRVIAAMEARHAVTTAATDSTGYPPEEDPSLSRRLPAR